MSFFHFIYKFVIIPTQKCAQLEISTVPITNIHTITIADIRAVAVTIIRIVVLAYNRAVVVMVAYIIM
jgi:hypothetical protein